MIDMTNDETVSAIAKVASQIASRYRNGVTLVGISNDADAATYLRALDAALTACRCKHIVSEFTLDIEVVDKIRIMPKLVTTPSLVAVNKRWVVLAVPKLAGDTVFLGSWLVGQHAKGVEISLYQHTGEAPKWVNRDYIAVLHEEPIASENMAAAQDVADSPAEVVAGS